MLTHAFRALGGLAAGTGAWFSLGVLGVIGEQTRVGLLPPFWLLGILVLAGLVVAVRWRRPPLAALWLPIVIVLAWVGPLTPVLSVWAGPFALVVWMLVLTSCLDMRQKMSGGATAAAIVCTVVVALFGWSVDSLGVTGDEPHYLLIATSVLEDGDVNLANDYGDTRYSAFYSGPLEPRHVVLAPSGAEYSFHGHGVPMVILPAFAVGGVAGARVLLLAVSVAGLMALWHAARLITGSTSAAHVALLTLACTPFLAQATAIYPDGPGAAIVAFLIWTIVRGERERELPVWNLGAAGAALAALPWLHLRLGAIAACFGLALLLLQRRSRNAASNIAVLVAAPLVSVAALVATTWVMFETWDPTAPFRQKAAGSLSALPIGMAALLFDQEFGLLVYAPAVLIATAGIPRLLRAAPFTSAAGGSAVVATLVTAASYVWWGGTTSPARFLVPVLPVVALAAAAWWTHAGERSVAVWRAFAAVAVSFAIWTLTADGGRHVITAPGDGDSLIAWSSDLVDMRHALPSFFRPQVSTEGVVAAVWVLSAGIIVGLARWSADWGTVVWISVATSVSLAIAGAGTFTADRSQLALLQASTRAWLEQGFASDRLFHPRREVLARLSFGNRARDAREHYALLVPRVPAGRYSIASTDRRLAMTIGRDSHPLYEWTTAAEAPDFTLVMPVHSIRVKGEDDEGARASLHVREVFEPGAGLTAQRVTRCGRWLVYAIDGRTAADNEGFSLSGGRRTPVVFANDKGEMSAVDILLQAQDSVTVAITVGEQRAVHALAAGAASSVTVPAHSPRTPIVFEVAAPVKGEVVRVLCRDD